MRQVAKGYLFFGTQLWCQWLDWFLLDIADRTGFCNLPIITLTLWYNKKSLVSAKINQSEYVPSAACLMVCLSGVNNVQRAVLDCIREKKRRKKNETYVTEEQDILSSSCRCNTVLNDTKNSNYLSDKGMLGRPAIHVLFNMMYYISHCSSMSLWAVFNGFFL